MRICSMHPGIDVPWSPPSRVSRGGTCKISSLWEIRVWNEGAFDIKCKIGWRDRRRSAQLW